MWRRTWPKFKVYNIAISWTCAWWGDCQVNYLSFYFLWFTWVYMGEISKLSCQFQVHNVVFPATTLCSASVTSSDSIHRRSHRAPVLIYLTDFLFYIALKFQTFINFKTIFFLWLNNILLNLSHSLNPAVYHFLLRLSWVWAIVNNNAMHWRVRLSLGDPDFSSVRALQQGNISIWMVNFYQ